MQLEFRRKVTSWEDAVIEVKAGMLLATEPREQKFHPWRVVYLAYQEDEILFKIN